MSEALVKLVSAGRQSVPGSWLIEADDLKCRTQPYTMSSVATSLLC